MFQSYKNKADDDGRHIKSQNVFQVTTIENPMITINKILKEMLRVIKNKGTYFHIVPTKFYSPYSLAFTICHFTQ